MKLRTTIILLTLIMTLSLVYSQDNKFRLKPEAKGKLCLSCHPEFEETLKSKFVHTPVKTGECSECHNPHTSSHGKLLYEDPNKVCSKCHKEIIPDKAKSTHKIVFEGNCVNCHDPHASNNTSNLLKAGNELCFGCHKDMGDAIAKVKFKHNPVEKGCVNCHDPHGSAKSDHLLKNDLVSLCAECHKPDNPAFVRQHMNYPMAKANCPSCHDVHGSDKAGILFTNVHSPVANKMCAQCHEAPSSSDPFKTKKAGYELCRGCHSNMVNEALNKNRIHWPLLDKEGCLHCHQPHASTRKNLINEGMTDLCGKCHGDTIGKQIKLAEIEKEEKAGSKIKEARGAFTHNPVQEGDCGACHFPHASDSVLLLKQTSVIDLCATCHDWQKHSTHPIGEKVVDLRNKNMTMDCLSCHRSHGTGYRWMLTFKTPTHLCVQCHKQYKR